MCDPHFHLLNILMKAPTGVAEQPSQKLSNTHGRLPDTWLRACAGGEEVALGAHDWSTKGMGYAPFGVLDQLEYKHKSWCTGPHTWIKPKGRW